MTWIGLCVACALMGAEAADQPTVVVVVGAAGSEEYGRQFTLWAERWQRAAETGGARCLTVGLESSNGQSDRQRLQGLLRRESLSGRGEFWLLLIGHGTFDGRSAKFNLRGPDVSAGELKEWLSEVDRPTAVINCASASGPFLRTLSAEGRIVISATKSGFEQNFARFGDYLSQTITDPAADLDKDGQTSLLEAFLSASHRTQEFYRVEGRLPTEHALLDDNGDALGSRADWFRGLRAIRDAGNGKALDGLRSHQRHLVRSRRERQLSAEQRRRRDELELAVIQLRRSKSQQTEQAYFQQLERLLLQLADLYVPATAKRPQPRRPVSRVN